MHTSHTEGSSLGEEGGGGKEGEGGDVDADDDDDGDEEDDDGDEAAAGGGAMVNAKGCILSIAIALSAKSTACTTSVSNSERKA